MFLFIVFLNIIFYFFIIPFSTLSIGHF